MAIEMPPQPKKYLERTDEVINREKEAVRSLRRQLLEEFPGDPELQELIKKQKEHQSEEEEFNPSPEHTQPS
jgi:hypothetical protein